MRIAILFLFALAAASVSAQWQTVNVNKVTLEGTLKDGGVFEVKVDSDVPKELSGEYFGSADSPRVVVSGIVVKTTGTRISFPKEAFVDLANPLLQTTSVTSQGANNVKLRFTGGEGAQNYEVEYFIEGNKLVKRNVSFFKRGGKENGRIVKTMTFGPAGEVTQQP
jgi:hypothetical protein